MCCQACWPLVPAYYWRIISFTEDPGDGRALKKWTGFKPGPTLSITASEFKEILINIGFEIHVHEDLLDPFRNYVRGAWEEFLKGVAEGAYMLDELGPALLESTRWMVARVR